MIYEKFKLPLCDFIERAEEIPNLVGAILFGSAISGGVSKKSDIDILLVFDCKHDPETGKESKIVHQIASEISLKYDLVHTFSFVFFNQRRPNEIETDFLWNVAKEGILIWARPQVLLFKKLPSHLRPFVILSYSLQGLKEKDRRKFLRHLYGGKRGLVDKEKERLAPGLLFLEAEKFERIKELFDRFNVKNYGVKKLWGQ